MCNPRKIKCHAAEDVLEKSGFAHAALCSKYHVGMYPYANYETRLLRRVQVLINQHGVIR